MIATLSVTEIGVIVGIVLGGGGIVPLIYKMYRERPEPQTLVMSTGETGVKILDNVIDTLQTELARRTANEQRLEALLNEQNALFRQLRDELEAALHEKATLERQVRELEGRAGNK